MKERFLEYAVCPMCRGTLDLTLPRSVGVMGEIRSGSLGCPACRVEYQIRNYIPRFVPPDNYASSFGVEWTRHARTQLDRFSGTDISRDRYRRTTRWPDRLDGQRILEAGCGAGRFTEIVLQTGAELVSFDLSQAVDVCLENHGLSGSWHLFQGDIYALPLRTGLFNKVFCLGVLQHCPDVAAAFRALLPPLRPGGEFAIDVYEYTSKMYLTPRFWLRLLTRRMRPERLYSLVRWGVPRLLPLKTWIKDHVPLLGRYLHILIPIAYYRGVLPLSESQLLEWSILDTFDFLSPRYENRVRLDTVREWFQQAGSAEFTVELSPHGIIGIGAKAAAFLSAGER